MSSGSLGDLAVVGGRCLGGAGFARWVSGPFSLSSSSLPCSAAPAELQPFFHPWAGSVRCGYYLLLTDKHITIRNKQGAIDLKTTGFLK